MLRTDTPKGEKNSLVRFVLVLYFFVTCILIPVFNVLPFLEQTMGSLGNPPVINRYYHEALGSATRWSLFGIGEVVIVPGMVISWLKWIMPLLGTLTLVLAVWVFIQELHTTQSSIFPFFRKVSFLSIGSIWLEWIVFFCLIWGDNWDNIIPEAIILPPIPNTFLLGLMLSGTFTLLLASSSAPLKVNQQLSSIYTSNLKKPSLLKESSQKNRGRIFLRVVLIIGFSFTCVGIPFLRIMPFMQVQLIEGEVATFFFDHFLENGYIHPYLRIPSYNSLRFLLGMSGWLFLGFGTCIFVATIYSIIRGVEFHEKTFLPILHRLSLITVVAIIMEWIFILMLMGDKWLLPYYQTTPLPNFLLLMIMISGIICLIVANLIPTSSPSDSPSSNGIISKSA